MKYEVERLRDLGLTDYEDLNLVRVRTDGKNREKIEKLIEKDEFPNYNIKAPSDLPYSFESYFNFIKELEDINFPFTKTGSVTGLFYDSLRLGLKSLKEKLKKELFEKVHHVVSQRLIKGIDWETEIKMMAGAGWRGLEVEEDRAFSSVRDIPEEVRAKIGIKIISIIVKYGVLTAREWNQRETGYKHPNMCFSDFSINCDKDEMIFCSERGGNPAQRLKLVTADQNYKNLYISWAVLRTKKDLKEEDDIEPEMWVAHNGKVYSDQDYGTVFEAEEFDAKEQKIMHEEIILLRRSFEIWCQW